MTPIQFSYYNKWFNYLNNLEARRFTMSTFVDGNINNLGKNKPLVWSRACPAGYLPIIFPNDWEYIDGSIPLLINNSTGLYSKDMAIFFGIDEQEVLQITVPKYYKRPTLDAVLKRIKVIGKVYGFLVGLRPSYVTK